MTQNINEHTSDDYIYMLFSIAPYCYISDAFLRKLIFVT